MLGAKGVNQTWKVEDAIELTGLPKCALMVFRIYHIIAVLLVLPKH